MSMGVVLFEVVMALLMLALIVYCVKLNRGLAAVRGQDEQIKQMIAELNSAADRAEASVARLKSAGLSAEAAVRAAIEDAEQTRMGDWQAMVESLSRSFKVEEPHSLEERAAERNVRSVRTHRGADLGYLESLITGVRDNQASLAGMMIRRLSDRLIISFPGELLFGPGRVDPVPAARKRIVLLTEILRNIPNRVEIFGHTDPTRVLGLVFESNWELSLARADAVAAMMVAAGYDRPIDSFGLADSRYSDLADVPSVRRRQTLARRVDIVIRNQLSDRR